MSDGAEERDQLERELAQVVRELERREALLQGLERSRAEHQAGLQELSVERLIRVGDAGVLQQASARRQALTRQIGELDGKIKEARSEVQRARERKQEIEAEMENSNAAD